MSVQHHFKPGKPPLSLLCKLGAIAVHVEEMLSVDGRALDKMVLEGLIADSEVQAWIKAMGPLLPVKRLPDVARKAIEDIRGR